MTKKNERLREITRLLEINNVLTVKELSHLLDVSHMTVRRDLIDLESQHIVSLIHGGAALSPYYSRAEGSGEYELPTAKTAHIREKMRIGLKAASIPSSGDTIILDSGSTTECIAKSLNPGLELKVICFAINILIQVYRKGCRDIIFAGGHFHENTLMFESPESLKLIQRYRAAYGFISASGIDAKLGVTCATDYETATKQAALASCKQRILVADSSKFGRVGPSCFADLGDFDTVITDGGIPEEYAETLRKKNIKVIIT